MADKQISDLTSASALTDGSLFVLEQSGAAMKANWGMMKNYISPDLAPLYSNSSKYNVGDYVIYNDNLYRCITAITTAESWTASHWREISVGEDLEAAFNSISDITGNTIIDFIKGYYINTSGSTCNINSPVAGSWKYAVVEVAPGDKVTVSGEGGASARLFAFVKANGDIIDKANNTYSTTNRVLTIPSDCKYLVLNNRLSNNQNSYIGELLLEKVESAYSDSLKVIPMDGVTDLNDVKTTSIGFLGYNTTYQNDPIGAGANRYVKTYEKNSTEGIQSVVHYSNTRQDIYERYYLSGSFSPYVVVFSKVENAREKLNFENYLLGAFFERGYSAYSDGSIDRTVVERVTHENYVSYPFDVLLQIKGPYTFNAFDNAGTLLKSTSATPLVVKAGTQFRVNIRPANEVPGVNANVSAFSHALVVVSLGSALSLANAAPKTLDTHYHTVAHRGVPALTPAATKPSYCMAKRMGLLIAEGDVRFTSDNVPVLFHDATYTVNGVTHTIAEETYDQFMQYDIGAAFSADYAGTYGLTLSEFLDLCNDLQLRPTIEFKTGTTAQVQACLNLIDSKRSKIFNYKASVANLKTIIDHDPTASVRLGDDNYSNTLYNNLVEIINYGEKKHTTHCIYSNYGTWTSENIAQCRNAGAIIGVSSINTYAQLSALTEDVDIIFTEHGFNATAFKTIKALL